jgi:hypothetical protein
MAGALADAVRPPHRAGLVALEHRPLVDHGSRDHEVVGVEVVVVLGVGDRRVQRLEHRLGGTLRREGEQPLRLGHGQPADVRDDLPDLVGGDANVARGGLHLPRLDPAIRHQNSSSCLLALLRARPSAA